MNVSDTVTDNITELLIKILDFTVARHRVLTENINSMHITGFIPMDLAVEEFALLMECAVAEHKLNKRLLLCDTNNIKFGPKCSVTAEPIIDENARRLLATSMDEYLELQLKKLSENALNRKIAAELLKQKQGKLSILSNHEV
jgi:hypothetical protein